MTGVTRAHPARLVRFARLVLPLLLAAPLEAQTARPMPAVDSISPERVARLVATLSDDSLEGRAIGGRGAMIAAQIIADAFHEAGLEPAGDSGYFQRVPFAKGPAVNVIGLLRGGDSALRDTAVVIDAHYDHLGIGRPVHGDSIYNGADDDASGTVAVMETARALARAGTRPRRTIVFLLLTGEEIGGTGNDWYLRHPAIPLARTAANLEIEMIGRPDPLAGGRGKAWLTGYARSTMGALLAQAGVPVVPDPRPAEQFFERSDNIAFAYRGIPAHTISSFNLHADYHRPSDEASRTDAAHMAAVIDAVTRATWILADGPAPRWNPGGRPRP